MKSRIATAALGGLLAALAAASPATPAEPGAEPAPFVPGELIVKVEGEPTGTAIELPEGVGVRAAARTLREKPEIAYAVPNYIATASALPNDPGTAPGEAGERGGWMRKQWNFLPCTRQCEPGAPTTGTRAAGGIDAIGAWRNLKRSHRTAHGIVVAVLDTGIAYRRAGTRFRRSPDFGRRQFVKGRDFVKGDALPLDENGHGTHVAGTIAERTDNGIAVTGLSGARLMPVRVLNGVGNGQADNIAHGIRYAARHGADVINMSFNFSCSSAVPSVVEALRYAHRRGVVLVAAVGNWDPLGSDPRDCVQMPALAPHVIGVGGTTESACLGAYSRHGPQVDVVAPGGGPSDGSCADSRPIYQLTFAGAGYTHFGLPGSYVGTSMAAAHVSGVAALVLASRTLGRKPSPDRVAWRLKATARDLGATGNDDSYGRGLIDAAAATAPRSK